jgi:anaerobic selenocysteine-containing dehydrogenase
MGNATIDAKGTKRVHVSCPHDCPDGCSMSVTVDLESGKAIRVEGDKTHPVTQGFLCGKVNSYLDYVYNDQRVLYPQRRVGPKGPGAKWTRITWDEALTEIADRLKETIDKDGAESVLPFSYSGTMGMTGFLGMGQRFFNRMGACRLERTICTAAGAAAEQYTFGRVGDANIENLPKMDVILLWGTNIVSTGVHAMPFLEQARKNGAQIVAIDPRVTRTTDFADWHLAPKPGTDAALAIGMMKLIVDKGLHDETFLNENTVGWNQFVDERLSEYSLEKVAAITGLEESDIVRLSDLYASTKNSFIRCNWGIQRHENGGAMMRAIKLLPTVTGAAGGDGGVCVSTGGELRVFNEDRFFRADLLKGRNPRTFNMIQLGNALNKANPEVKALFVWNADPANCVPDTKAARHGLSRTDLFTVVHDTFYTDSALYADILLPADTALERMDILAGYGAYYYGLSLPAIDKVGESLDNSEMFRRLAEKMGYTEDCFSQTDEEMIEEIIDPEFNPLFEGVTLDLLKKQGWAKGAVDSPRRKGINSGVWPTPSGKIEFYSQQLAELGLDPMPIHIPEVEGLSGVNESSPYPLQVFSAATHYFIGSTFQHVEHLQKMLSRPTFELSPYDADKRSISEGDLCRLFNDRGEVFGHAHIVNGLKPGVLGAPKQLQGSKMKNGFNLNALTSQREADMGRGPVYYSTLAEIQKVDASLA